MKQIVLYKDRRQIDDYIWSSLLKEIPQVPSFSAAHRRSSVITSVLNPCGTPQYCHRLKRHVIVSCLHIPTVRDVCVLT